MRHRGLPRTQRPTPTTLETPSVSSRFRSGLALVLIPCALALGCGGGMSQPEAPAGMTEGPHRWPAIPLDP